MSMEEMVRMELEAEQDQEQQQLEQPPDDLIEPPIDPEHVEAALPVQPAVTIEARLAERQTQVLPLTESGRVLYGSGQLHVSHKLRYNAQVVYCNACGAHSTGGAAKKLFWPCWNLLASPGAGIELRRMQRGLAARAAQEPPHSTERGRLVVEQTMANFMRENA